MAVGQIFVAVDEGTGNKNKCGDKIKLKLLLKC
jgi:hypothetical protein